MKSSPNHGRCSKQRATTRSVVAAFFLLVAVTLGFVSVGATQAQAAAPLNPGDSVYVGDEYTPGTGTPTFPIYASAAAAASDPSNPEYWAYCVEHNVDARPDTGATVRTVSSFLGSNLFTNDPTVQGDVLWVLTHTIPYVDLADMSTAANIPNLTRDEAINGTVDAIWRYTDLGFDAPWSNWIDPNAEAVDYYLINGANASGRTLTPGDLQTTVSVTPPTGAQTAHSLIGPFVIHTNQATATVSSTPAATLTDSAGNPINAAAVVDGQQVYLDLRGSTSAGTATVTVTATAKGAIANGFVVSTPATGTGTATTANHAQSFIMIAARSATTSADADVSSDPHRSFDLDIRAELSTV